MSLREGTLFGTQNLSSLNLSMEIEDEFWSGHEEINDSDKSRISKLSSFSSHMIDLESKKSMTPESNQLIKLRLVEDAYKFPEVAKNKHLDVEGLSRMPHDTPKFKFEGQESLGLNYPNQENTYSHRS
jgi:hypothetical protein